MLFLGLLVASWALIEFGIRLGTRIFQLQMFDAGLLRILFFPLNVQILCAYPDLTAPLVWNGFSAAHFLSRSLVALILIPWAMGSPLRDLGFKAPNLRSAHFWCLGIFFITLPLIVLGIRLIPQVGQYYSHYSHQGLQWPLVAEFSLFIFSSVLGSEMMFRGSLLFGMIHLFKNHSGLQESSSRVLAVALVVLFEALSHINKPLTESLGMIAFSPLLSGIALNTGSLLVPLALHLYLETVFFLTLIF